MNSKQQISIKNSTQHRVSLCIVHQDLRVNEVTMAARSIICFNNATNDLTEFDIECTQIRKNSQITLMPVPSERAVDHYCLTEYQLDKNTLVELQKANSGQLHQYLFENQTAYPALFTIYKSCSDLKGQFVLKPHQKRHISSVLELELSLVVEGLTLKYKLPQNQSCHLELVKDMSINQPRYHLSQISQGNC